MLLAALLGFWLGTDAPAQPFPATGPLMGTNPPRAAIEAVLLPRSTPDPLEPVNRLVWGFNKAVLRVVKPTAKLYRFIVRKPLRDGLGNFARNLSFPGRLINNLLEGKWAGARHETDRFFCNTIAGGAGCMDVATRWHIPKSDADFGQTFGQWGWTPACYLMLPIFGPSNERDLVGLAGDTAVHPVTYLNPYPFVPDKPLTYLSPYTYYSFAVVYNSLADTVDSTVRLSRADMDSYATIQYAWTFVRHPGAPDFAVKGTPDPPTLQTLQSILFKPKNPEFPNRSKTRSVLIPATRRKLEVTYWLQPGPAPIVYIVPGLGSHRLSDAVLALAELAYERGYSAACLSSAYNHEFMEHGSTAALPGYTPVDAHDLHVALTAIDQRLRVVHPERLGTRTLLGYSMGAFHTLYLAAAASTNEESLLKFDRYVAINPPVRLMHGVAQLDALYQTPLEWAASNRMDQLENTLLKVAALSKAAPSLDATLPFDRVESRFLIGMAFRFILRDMIYSSQERRNQGILSHPIRKWRRAGLYREILQYSYQDYFEDFLVPYYQTRGVDLTTPEALERAGDLRPLAPALQANPDIRMVVNRNDILLTEEDLAWVQSVFEPARLTLFENGGHLGNLARPEVQQAIGNALDGLGPSR